MNETDPQSQLEREQAKPELSVSQAIDLLAGAGDALEAHVADKSPIEKKATQSAKHTIERAFLNITSRVVPDIFKPRLYAVLKEKKLLLRYVETLSINGQHAELSGLERATRRQIVDNIKTGNQEEQPELIVMLCQTLKNSNEFWVKRAFSEIIAAMDRQQVFSVPSGANYLRPLLEVTNTQLGKPDLFSEIRSNIKTREGLLFFIDSFAGAQKSDFLEHLLDKLYSFNDKQVPLQLVIEHFHTIQGGARTEIAGIILASLSGSEAESIPLARQVLDQFTGDDRVKLIEQIASRGGLFPFTLSGTEQLQQIVELTSVPSEQYRIFWKIAAVWAAYDNVPGFSLDEAVRMADTSADTYRVVIQLIKSDKLSDEVKKEYGKKIISSRLSNGPLDPRTILWETQEFGVSLDEFTDIINAEVATNFHSRQLTSDWARLIEQLDNLELATDWQEFDIDMSIGEGYAETTWRPEQSLIDIMQNHLDADDLWKAMSLVEAAYGREHLIRRRDSGGLNYEASSLLDYMKTWPHGEEDAKTTIEDRGGNFERFKAVVEQIKDIKPTVELLISYAPDQEERWIPLDQLRLLPLANIVGFRFRDHGLGYDKELNATFAPTKQDMPFLRGKFGQGAKLSMIDLLRHNCQINIHSAAVLLDTRERLEWRGTGAFSEASRTYHLQGTERRTLLSDQENQGTTVEVRFDQAPAEIRKLFSSILDTRQGSRKGLGEYVVEYMPENPFIKASKDVKSQVAIDPTLKGKLYVQGLEVPTTNLECHFAYNLGSSDFLTGRDRKYIELKKAQQEIGKLWAGISDKTALTELYTLLLSGKFLYNEVEASDEFIAELSFSLRRGNSKSEDLIGLHREVLEATLFDDNEKIAFATSRQDVTPEEQSELKQLGVRVVVVNLVNSYTFTLMIEEIIGKDRIVDIYDLRRRKSEKRQEDLEGIPEAIRSQLTEQVTQSQQELTQLLASFELPALSQFLGNINVEWAFIAGGSWGSFISSSLVSDKDDWRKVTGIRLNVYPEILFRPQATPEQLNPEQALSLKYAIDAELLKAVSLHVMSGGAAASELDGYQYGQDLANTLLFKTASTHAEVYQLASEPRLHIDSVNTNFNYRNLIEADLNRIQLIGLVRELEEPFVTATQVKRIVEQIQPMLVDKEMVREVAGFGGLNRFNGKVYVDGDEYFELSIKDVVSFSENTSKLQVELVPRVHKLVGHLAGGEPVYQVGSDIDARLVIPVDMTEREVVILKKGDQETVLSKYQRAKGENSGRNVAETDPEALFNTTWSGKASYLDECYLSNNLIVVPIGTYGSADVSARAEYFVNSFGLSIDFPGVSEFTEDMTGQPYVETNAAIDYGQGNVWDDPIRFFGDVIQNHLDGGKASIRYFIAGKDEPVTQEELLSSENSNAQLVGVSFEDDGLGYTTHGLRRWGDSTKTAGGKRGMFGEGLKMLASSSKRNGIEFTSSSRDWVATVGSYQKKMVSGGQDRAHEMIRFNMDWLPEPQPGSKTQVRLPSDPSEKTMETWAKWMEVMDPRSRDRLGHGGLARYARELRTETDRVVQIGPVKFLLDEPGVIYERGLVMPGAMERLGTHFMFGLDIDADIKGSQERNVVDYAKLKPLLDTAYRQATPELCQAIFEQIRDEVSGVASLQSLSNGEKEKRYQDFNLVGENADLSSLRIAFTNVFGEGVILSSKDRAEDELQRLVGKLSTGVIDFSEFQQHKHRLLSIIANEEDHFSTDSVLKLDDLKYKKIRDRLDGKVPSATMLVDSVRGEVKQLSPEEQTYVDELSREVAATLAEMLRNMLNDKGTKTVVEKVLAADERKLFGEKLTEPTQSELENAIYYLEMVAQGMEKIKMSVLPAVYMAGGVADGENSISISETTFTEPGTLVGTMIHELLHIVFKTKDYNPTFYGLLLLSNPVFAQRYMQA